MKTNPLKIYAAPVVLLLLAGGLATSPASADDTRDGRKTVSTPFAYSRAAPAEQVMRDLERTVDRHCRTPGIRPLNMRQVDEMCVAEAMQDGIRKIPLLDARQTAARTG
jgi:UrcA family protein